MSKLEEGILKKFRTNYENAIRMIPEKFRQEFRNKIIPEKDLEVYATLASKTLEFQSEITKSLMENKMRAQFSIGRFGRRLIINGIRPEQIYIELVKGIFDKPV